MPHGFDEEMKLSQTDHFTLCAAKWHSERNPILRQSSLRRTVGFVDLPQKSRRARGSPAACLTLSLDLDPLPGDISRDFRYEVPGGVVEVQLKRASLHIAALTQTDRFTQVDGTHKVSVGVIVPHPVSEFESPARRPYPSAQADVARPGVDVRIVHFSPATIPVLEGFLDRLAAHDELDIPQPHD